MADIATLGVRVDAGPALNDLRQLRAELANVSTAGKAVSTTAQASAVNINRLREPLTSLAASVGALPGPLGRLGSVLGQFALGGGATVAALAGLSAIGLAYRALAGDAKSAAAESRALADQLMNDARRLSEYSKQALLVRQATVEAQRNALMLAIANQGKPTSAHPDLNTSAGRFAYGAATAAQKATFVFPTVSEAEARKLFAYDKALQEVKIALNAVAEAERRAAEAAGGGGLRRIGTANAATIPTGGLTADPAAFFRDLERKRIESAQRAADAAAKAEEDAAERARAAWEQMHSENMKTLFQIADAMASVLGNTLGNIDKRMGTGSLFSGVGMGLATDNPYAATASILNTVTDALFGMGEQAQRLRAQVRATTQETAGYTDQLEVLLGVMSSVEARQRAVTREYAAQREDLERALEAARRHGWNDIVRDLTVQLDALNALTRARLDVLRAETLLMNVAMAEDLRVRLLRAQGRAEEADALALAIRHQREYANAMRDGADIINLYKLREVQRLEAVALAMTQAQQRVDAFTSTINGLQDFRNSLLLSATQSPTARLAEARRQYGDVLSVVQGPDIQRAQEASGRLPGIAQILLDASRTVNASGAGFQSDFQQVLTDAAAAIARFSDLRTIEEQMLEELKRIRDNTGRDSEEVLRPRGSIDPDGNVTHFTNQMAASINVLQEGFTRLSADVRAVSARLDNIDGTFRRAFDGLGTRLLS